MKEFVAKQNGFPPEKPHQNLYCFDHFLYMTTIIYIKMPGNGVVTEFKSIV